jgi:hypothetical protein
VLGRHFSLRGRGGDGARFIGDAVGSEGRAAGGATRRQGMGAWGQRSVAGNGPAMVLVGGARMGGARLVGPSIVPGSGGLNTFQIQMNSNYFITFQTLTDPKMALPSLKI